MRIGPCREIYKEIQDLITGHFSNVHILLIKGFSNKGLRQIEYQEKLNNALLSVAFQRILLHLKEINQLERRITHVTTSMYFKLFQFHHNPNNHEGGSWNRNYGGMWMIGGTNTCSLENKNKTYLSLQHGPTWVQDNFT